MTFDRNTKAGNKTENEVKLHGLIREREQKVNRVFFLAFEIILIFGVPALVAMLIIWRSTSNKIAWVVLPSAFILSWTFMIFRYMKISREMKDLDAQIKELKENSN